MPWAIYDNLSGVTELEDFGIHATELDALQALILRLESEKTDIVTKIASAKRRRARITRRTKYVAT